MKWIIDKIASAFMLVFTAPLWIAYWIDKWSKK